jgi:hypothetical protein
MFCSAILNLYPCVSKQPMIAGKIHYSFFHQPKPLEHRRLQVPPSVLDNANFILTNTITFTPSSNSSPLPVLYSNTLLLTYRPTAVFHTGTDPIFHPLVAVEFLPRQSRVSLDPLLPSTVSYSDCCASHFRYSRFVSITSRCRESLLS